MLVAANGTVYYYGDARCVETSSCLGIGSHQITVADVIANPAGPGGWTFSTHGSVYPFGGTSNYGQPGNQPPPFVAVAAAATADGHGYWVLTANGTVYSYGDARPATSGAAAVHVLPQDTHAVAIIPEADAAGYWIVTSSGAVLNENGAPSLSGATQTGGAPVAAAGGW